MKTFFDASVLVPLLNLESPHHAQAAAFWTAAQERATSAHALAESFRTLTSLKRPVPPRVAQALT